MDNPNINNNEALYRSQIREFFEDRFGAYLDEGHYISELKSFRNTVEAAEENDTTVGNYGSYDAIYATRKDVIIGFIEYWLTEGYQRFNQNNKFIIILPINYNDIISFSISGELKGFHQISKDTDFTTIYNDIFDNIKAEWLNTIATKEFAIRVIQPNYIIFFAAGSDTNGVNIKFTKAYSNLNLEYSYDGITWNNVSFNVNIPLNLACDLNNVSSYSLTNNSYIMFRGNNTALCSLNESNYIGRFYIQYDDSSGLCFIGGSIQSLIYKEDTQNKYIACDNCFYGLFANVHLYGSLELPATELKERCYEYMFGNSYIDCKVELPATVLKPYCYYKMFYNTESIDMPELPATTLAPYCYAYMFALSDINPLNYSHIYLPATKMEEGCYVSMFDTCTSITTAPMLPAYKLAKNCYFKMFAGCSSLTQAPELPATELAPGCYDSMFHSCTSLEIAPELPAKKLPQQCYSYMFAGCTNLKYVKALFTEITCGTTGAINSNPNSSHSSICNWLSSTNTNSTSKVILHTDLLYSKDYENWTIGHSLTGTGNWILAPTNWQIYGIRNYLHFKPSPESKCKSWNLAIHIAKFDDVRYDGSYLNLNYKTTYDISVNPSTGAITEYPWTTINGYIDANTAQTNQTVPTTEGSSPLISIPFGEDGVYICNALDYEDRDPKMDRRWKGYISIDSNSAYHTHFDCIPQNTSTPRYIDMFGDLRSIFYMDNTFEQYDELPNSTYHKYWSDYSRPAYMFYSNTYLRHCYTSCNIKRFIANMYEAAFADCSNLIYLPNFGTDPLIPLNYATFNATFSGCTSLEYAPELPYLTYSDEDYTCGGTTNGYKIGGNFYTEPTGCYSQMFYGCNNIKFIPNIFPLRYLCGGIYIGMFNMESAYLRKSEFKKMPEVIGVTGIANCLGAMFAYCDLREVQCIPLTTITGEPYTDRTLWAMFTYNQNLKTAMHILPLTTLKTNTYLGMFEDCRKLAVAPKIQAKTVDTDCIKWSFLRCYNLKYTNTSVTSTTTTPFYYTGNNTLKEYSSGWKNSDKSGMLYVHTGQYDGLSQGYYKAALYQYSLNPKTNKYDYDLDYWIYVKSRKFADGNTYYIWRKYYESSYLALKWLYRTIRSFYIITKECIIPECIVTSESDAESYNPSSITKQYTVVGYLWADYDMTDIFDLTGNIDYTGDTYNNGSKKFLKVLMIKAE